MDFLNKLIDLVFALSKDTQIFLIALSAVVVAGMALFLVLTVIMNNGGV